MIPHITNEIKDLMLGMAGAAASTSSSTRSAAPSATSSRCRSWRPPGRSATTSAGRTCSSCTCRWCPTSGRSGELKTKPTQHSVAALRQVGIQPDAIVCRSDREIPDGVKRKISLMCDVDEEAVVSYPTPRRSTTSRRCCTPRAWTPTSSAGWISFRDVNWKKWNDLLRAGAPAQGGRHHRSGRQIRRPAGRLPERL